ncbi:hypothetical protein [Terasakiella pusilla]|uniref:hypothetical protein n=1 Tax=Terasakiella pusilla TaxID=64973 RepID=UPI003AA913F7
MAILKPGKRQLFRTQALKFFVGAFGDNSAPTLLFAWPRYMGAIVIACCLVLSLIWLGFAERPLRLTVSGQLTPINTSSYCFTTPHRNLAFNTIKVGQTGVLLIEKEAVRVKTASFACPTNALPLRLERQIELSDQKVQLSLTIGYEPFWSFMI